MIEAVNFLIDNIYVRFGKRVNRQVVCIPMGTSCAPLIADLFLYCYESQFMTKLIKDPSKLHIINKFNNIYRYPYDILSLNTQKFSQYTADIYPEELTLNKSNVYGNNCLFLNLDISVLNGKLHFKIYGKRDDF